MSELRLYLRRDALREAPDCAWSLLGDDGQLRGSGTRLEDLPRARHCRLVLAGELVLAVKAVLPDLPDRRLTPLLPAAAEAATLVEADTIHAVLMAREGQGQARLAVVEDAWLRRVLNRLAELGVYPEAALPDYLLLPWTEGEWSVCWRGAESMVRFGRVEGMSLDDGDPPVALMLALAQRDRPAKLQLLPWAGLPEADGERWREALGVEVESAAPWDWRTCPWPDLPNLLQGRHSPSRSRVEWPRLARPAAWGVLLLAAIQLTGTALDWGLLARESAGIRKEMLNIAEKVLPAHAAVVDPALQVAEQLHGLRVAAGSPSPDALTGLLGRLGQVWPAEAAPRIRSMVFEAGQLSVLVASPEQEWLDQLVVAAPSKGLVVTVQQEKDPAMGTRLNVRSAAREASRGQ